MTGADKTRVLLFLGSVGFLYAAAGAIFLAWLWRKARRKPAPKRSPAGKWTRRSVLSLAGGGVGCMTWGRFVEPYWVEVTHNRITTTRLAGATRPIRLVHFSDMHCDPVIRNEGRLPDIIAQCRPDLIVYTGDSINSRSGLDNFRTCLKRIARVAPTFVSGGNWDTYFPGTDYFGQTGVTELNGTKHRFEVAGAHLWLAGTAVGKEGRLDTALAGIPEDDFKIFLYHYPDKIYTLAKRGVDLYCAGHTHGGQIALPLYGAIMTLSKYGKRFEAGLYKVEQTHLYVNRGIGMEGGAAPRVRFCARPEVTVIEIEQT